MLTLACRDDIRAEVVLERGERIKVRAVAVVEGLHGVGHEVLLKEVVLGN